MRHRRKPRNETNFCACLLAHGAKPVGQSAALYKYKEDVRAWWLDMNSNMNPPIKQATAYQFWNKYNRWYENMMTNERRKERCALDIAARWIK